MKTGIKFIALIMLVVMISTAMFGCSSVGGSDTPAPSAPPASSVQESMAAPSGNDDLFITIGTSTMGGTWYPMGGALASVINKSIPGFSATAVPSGGTIESATAMMAGNMEIAMGMVEVPYKMQRSMEGVEAFPEMRALCMFTSNLMGLIVKANSGINSIEDLRGKKVGVSPNSSSLYQTTEEVFKGFGMTFNDIQVYQGGINQQAQMLKDGNIDAMTMTLPESSAAPGVVELATTENIKMLPITDDALKIISDANPFYVKGIIPAGYVKGVDADVQTIKIGCVFFTSTAMSDDDIYNIVKAIFENKAELEAASPAWIDTTKETAAKDCPIPLHPGAEKYYKENDFPISYLP